LKTRYLVYHLLVGRFVFLDSSEVTSCPRPALFATMR